MKKAICFILALMMVFISTPVTSAKTKYMVSGEKGRKEMNIKDIAALLEKTDTTDPGKIYKTKPSLKKGAYKAGSTTASYQKLLLSRVNAFRKIAGLPAERLSSSYTKTMQYAATLMAVEKKMQHGFSKRPSGMSSSFFQTANKGLKSANIADTGDGTTQVIDIYMSEYGRVNAAEMGHRRWILNPTSTKTGFGIAQNGDRTYSAMYSIDRSGKDIDYNFIAWPSSGDFPMGTEAFEDYSAWSISVNPKKYATPNVKKLKVTMTRESDGKTFTLTSANKNLDGKYLVVDKQMYGIPNAIIFRPAAKTNYDGTWTVKITGLKSKSGKAATIQYRVNFVSILRADDAKLKVESVVLTPSEKYNVDFAKKVPGSTYHWYSDDESVASVNEANGVITGIADGITTVHCDIKVPIGETKTFDVAVEIRSR